MKFIFLLWFTLLCFGQEEAVTSSGETVLLFKDGTWKKKSKPSGINASLMKRVQLIGKKHKASKSEITKAYQLTNDGWSYTLPQPKSNQARWGNSDGRTTWWYGYWHNSKLNVYSQTMPKKSNSGIWIGDRQNNKGSYRRGGSPSYPNNIELILANL